MKNMTECDKFKRECIKLLQAEENKRKEEANRAEIARINQLTELACEKFQNEFPLAEFKNGYMHLCGDKFEIFQIREATGINLRDKTWTHLVNNKIEYAGYLKWKKNKKQANIEAWSILPIIFIGTPLVCWAIVTIFNL